MKEEQLNIQKKLIGKWVSENTSKPVCIEITEDIFSGGSLTYYIDVKECDTNKPATSPTLHLTWFLNLFWCITKEYFGVLAYKLDEKDNIEEFGIYQTVYNNYETPILKFKRIK